MKRFLSEAVAFKTSVCLCFTGSVILYMAACWFTHWANSISFGVLLQLLFISVIATLLQTIAFTPLVFKKLRYVWRMVLFISTFLPLLMIFAFAFEWFPVQNLYAWLIFTGIFLLTFLGISIGFEVYFSIMGKRYEGILGQYRREHDDNS